jgi:hypothetical protein
MRKVLFADEQFLAIIPGLEASLLLLSFDTFSRPFPIPDTITFVKKLPDFL